MGNAAVKKRKNRRQTEAELKSTASVLAEFKANPKLAKSLGTIPLLRNTPVGERNLLAGALERKTFKKGAQIIAQGGAADGLYFIESGTTKVTITDEDGKESEIAKLGETDYFGETALVNDAPRGASVYATSKVAALFLDKVRFEALIDSGRIELDFACRRAAITETFQSAGQGRFFEDTKKPANAVTKKDQAQAELCLSAVDSSQFFDGLNKNMRQQVVDLFYRQVIPANTAVVQQGESGINFYVVESGNFEVFVEITRESQLWEEGQEGKTQKVADRPPGTYFGDVALAHQTKRNATCTSSVESVVWILNRYEFRHLVQQIGEQRLAEYQDFMKEVKLLAPLSSSERASLADSLEEVHYPSGKKVFSIGDEGDAMYLVVNGVCLAYKYDENDQLVELATMERGDYFGERALLNNDVRAASVICQDSTFLLRLDRDAFERTLGPLEALLKRQVASYAQVFQEEEEAPEILDRSILMEDLQHIANLGQGAFGTVTLVQHRETKVTYALKAVSKQQIVETKQEEHILAEKKVMATVHHPFFVNLITTYSNADQVFLLLEPSLGGELFTTLRSACTFPDKTARFYAATVILGFEKLHKHNYVYRDLKPENLLIGGDGYIKITDFGFAKHANHKRCYTLCGTPEYLAPEILAVPNMGHGKGVDWWCVGVLIYEMLVSYTPFYHQDYSKMYARIKKGKFRFPSHVSKAGRDIISQFLQVNVNKRIGVYKGKEANIKAHPWFAGFDWDALLAKTLKAPIIPKIKDAFDTSNFSSFTPQEVPPYNPSAANVVDWDASF